MTTRRLTKLDFVSLLGTSFTNILAAAKVNTEVEAFVKLLDWATPDADSTSIDLDDPRVSYGLNALEAGGLLPLGKAEEILSNPNTHLAPLYTPARVYLREGNFITVGANEEGPSTYAAFWHVSALVAQLIAEGAQISGNADAGIEIFVKVSS